MCVWLTEPISGSIERDQGKHFKGQSPPTLSSYHYTFKARDGRRRKRRRPRLRGQIIFSQTVLKCVISVSVVDGVTGLSSCVCSGSEKREGLDRIILGQ